MQNKTKIYILSAVIIVLVLGICLYACNHKQRIIIEDHVTYIKPANNPPSPGPTAPGPGPTAPGETAGKPKPVKPMNGVFQVAVEDQVVQLVNVERERAGVKPLKVSALMTEYAKYKSMDMAEGNYFSHKDKKGLFVSDYLSKNGVAFRFQGENIGYLQGDYDIKIVAELLMKNWMNSEGHRENILSPNYTEIGVGVYQLGDKIYATQEFFTP